MLCGDVYVSGSLWTLHFVCLFVRLKREQGSDDLPAVEEWRTKEQMTTDEDGDKNRKDSQDS